MATLVLEGIGLALVLFFAMSMLGWLLGWLATAWRVFMRLFGWMIPSRAAPAVVAAAAVRSAGGSAGGARPAEREPPPEPESAYQPPPEPPLLTIWFWLLLSLAFFTLSGLAFWLWA